MTASIDCPLDEEEPVANPFAFGYPVHRPSAAEMARIEADIAHALGRAGNRRLLGAVREAQNTSAPIRVPGPAESPFARMSREVCEHDAASMARAVDAQILATMREPLDVRVIGPDPLIERLRAELAQVTRERDALVKAQSDWRSA